MKKILLMSTLVITGAIAITSCGGGDKPAEESTTTAPATEPGAAEPLAIWTVPADAVLKENPTASSPESIEKGKAHFTKYCVSCHGEAGKGDTPTGQAVKAANFHERLPGQSDGQIMWKLENGRGAMLKISAYSLTEADGWDIINYLRELTKES